MNSLRAPSAEHIQAFASDLYRADQASTYQRRDRLFGWLFLAQWVFAVALAILWSPYGWEGKQSATHIHVYYAVFFGAALTVPVLLMIRAWPGATLTRHAIAVAQMLWSALLVHLSGGRIETHFHIFGSLAFLAFYRDNKVLITGTLTAAGEHLLRGVWWPESVYGIINPEWWRFLEHAFWITFEDVVLVLGIVEGQRAQHALAERQAEAVLLNATLERKVEERTLALSQSHEELTANVAELKATQQRLVEASRKAGMAEVASNVLHNVGNVLNSVNVSASVVTDLVRNSKLGGLKKAVSLLQQQEHPGRFLSDNPQGKKVVGYLAAVTQTLGDEQARLVTELSEMQKNIDHIKVVVSMQQSHAKPGGLIEDISLAGLIDDALKLNEASSERHGVIVERHYEGTSNIESDRHKIFQILMNLLANARQALKDTPESDA